MIKLEPENIEAYKFLRADYSNSGQNDKALETTQRTLKLAPDDPSLYCNLGLDYYYSDSPDKYEKAIVALKKALELKPGYGDAYFQLGLCYWKLGQLEEASRISEILLEMDDRWDVGGGEVLQKLIARQPPSKPKAKE